MELIIDQKEVKFFNDIKCMPFDKLRTEFYEDISKLTVVVLDIEKVLCNIENKAMSNNLRSFVIDEHMSELIKFIKKRNLLIPPLINFIGSDAIIKDGKHRIALCIHLKIKGIPFLIRNCDICHAKILSH